MSWLTPKVYSFSTVDLSIHVAAAGNTTCAQGTAIKCTNFTSLAKPNITFFDTGGAHLCGVFDGGKLACAGNNARKQLGLDAGDNGGMYGFDGL